jgi:predicted glutamine amidotransferase
MCLIIVAPKGTNKYSELIDSAINNGAESNDDGYGYAVKFNSDSRVYISKGFTEVDKLKESIKSKQLTLEDELVIHFRIGTSGKKDANNCHPFVLSESQGEILTLEGFVDKPIVAHNGVFGAYTNNNSDYSDTYHFVKGFMGVPELINILKRDDELFKALFDKVINTNKLAFLFPDRDFTTIGNFISDEGYLFSNGGYNDYRVKNVGGKETYNHYNKHYDYDDFEYGFRGEYYNGLNSRVGFQRQKDKKSEVKVPKERSLKVILSSIEVDENNYSKLSFIPKENFNGFMKTKEYWIYNFRSHEMFASFYEQDNEHKVILSPINKITDNFHICPRSEFAEEYKTYNYLNTNVNKSKTAMKKLEKTLNRNVDKEVFKFKKTDVFKNGVKLFLEQFNPKQTKVNIVD